MIDYNEMKWLAEAALTGGAADVILFQSKCRPSVIGRLIGELDQLKSVNFDLQMGAEAAAEEIARLKAELAAELQRRWDGNEISAREHAEEVQVIKAEVDVLRKDAERYRYMRKCSCEFRSSLPNHDAVSEAEYDSDCDAGLSKESAK